ncbi:hypothetical protein [Hymenobacter lapidarius]|uniref:hypothetical protein n=1 Tax=Hymenobacter lapidarius TaxID=1908237 RepID=UPI000F799330|nr:hypothetical protein [Hymenobacter lapidarius]
MKFLIISPLLIFGAAAGAGCEKDTSSIPSQSCDNERILASYQNKEAIVTRTQPDTYCLIVDSLDISKGSFLLDNYLVPSTPLPVQYQVEGLRVLLTGRKKSCYGLTTFPTLRSSFGYKLEIDDIRPSTTGK